MTDGKRSTPYPQVDPQARFPEIEERVLAWWKEQGIFRESIERRPAGENGANEFVFYDGPPFANGLPHYGHLLTGYVKDVVPRYQTMRGRKVERRFGWDCHGLPAEMETEKELGVSGRQRIQEYGIENFNARCRASVLRYTKEWEAYVTRQARWVDFANDYKTMDLSYMESVMWAFKRLWEKGLVYEGYRVMPYSWGCETPLSNFETRLDNSYRPRQDPAITVEFRLRPTPADPAPTRMLAWTTTPWTLPSNLGLAVGADIDYAVLDKGGVRYVLAEASLPKYEEQLEGATRTGTRKGRDLVGRTYEPLFPFFADTQNAFRVLAGDFVNTEEGTGVVHLAPGFGEDDQLLCQAHGIPIICPVDASGRFTAEVPPYAGVNVFDANKDVIRDLKQAGVLVKHETYLHNYPHCWRTDTPLIYKAVGSWYVRVTDFRDRMVQLNQNIRWIPEHIRDGQFGKWLEGARDWSISRNRFWGTPLPVWRSDDPRYPRTDVYGSLDELERDFGVRPTDLHRPFVDQLVRKNPDDPTGKSMMRRVEEVLDCWFESGSMPFAQMHYPFENKEWFEHHFPADFIVEYVAQTRGWFYTMVVLATALFDKHPFRTCMCHGVVLDENGQKLSKRLRNYPSPEDIYRTHGADALRWFFVSSPILRGNDLQIDRDGKAIGEVIRLVINPIWNAYSFFCLYANSDGLRGSLRTASQQLLDRYILAKTHELVTQVTELMDAYDLPGACARVTAFVDALNNWYIRRSRERFWRQGKDRDKQDAYDTLFTVLHTLSRLTAPLIPLLTEEVYRGLTGERSVHLTDWPKASDFPENPELVRDMDRVRDVCAKARSIREKHNLRVRLPLRSLTVAGAEAHSLGSLADLVRDEVNVKELRLSDRVEEFGSFKLDVNARAVGPRLGQNMKAVMTASKQGLWKKGPGRTVVVAGQTLAEGEFTLRLEPKQPATSQPLAANDGLVILDIEVTSELEAEGTARDVVRLIQQARKDSGIKVSDRVRLTLELPPESRAAVEKHREHVAGETLAREIAFGEPAPGAHVFACELEGKPVRVGVSVVE